MKKSVFCVFEINEIIRDLGGVWAGLCATLSSVHLCLTFDRLRAKPTSLEYLYSISRATRGYLINLFLLLIINKQVLLRTLGMTDAQAP